MQAAEEEVQKMRAVGKADTDPKLSLVLSNSLAPFSMLLQRCIALLLEAVPAARVCVCVCVCVCV